MKYSRASSTAPRQIILSVLAFCCAAVAAVSPVVAPAVASALPAVALPWIARLPAQAAAGRPLSFLGTVQSIQGNLVTIKNDSGMSMQVAVSDGARLLRVEPGQTNLQGASSFALSDLQVGDRVLARGTPASSGNQLTAVMLVAIKKSDIAQKQQQEQADWQKRGVGGLVKSVDPGSGTVAISTAAGRGTLVIQVTKNTVIRRYAPGSIQFNDAKPAPLSDTKPGDQLRARGDRSADGQSLVADEIVSGTFLNIAGTIVSTDPTASTVTVNDLATKKQVVVHLTPDTQIRMLDPAVAQRIALRLKGPGPEGGASRGNSIGPGGNASEHAAGPSEARQGAGGPGGGGFAGGDPQRLIARAPNASLADLAKGSAVMLVATGGNGAQPPLAVSIVGGVEPMLQASASGSQAILSSAWNLGGGGQDVPQ